MAANPVGEARTTIDSLIELLNDKGKMELSKLSNILGVDQSVIDGWAKVLEAGGMVKITNEFGKMYVEPVTVSKAEAKALETTAVEESANLEAEVATQRTAIDKFVARLQSIGTAANTAEKIFQERLPELEQQLSGLNKIYGALEDENDRLTTIRKNAEKSYEDLNKKISVLQDKMELVDTNTVQAATSQFLKIEETLKRAGELEDQLDLLSKSKDRAIEVIRKSIEEQLKALQSELDKAERNVESQLRQHRTQIAQSVRKLKEQAHGVKQLTDELSTFRKEKVALKKSLESSRVNYNDEYAKITTHMENTSSTLKGEVGTMLRELDSLKANFGTASQLYDQITETKRDIAKTQKRIEDMRAELGKIADDARGIRTMKASAEAKAAAVKKGKEKVRKVEEQGDQLDEDIDDIARKLEGKGE